MSEIRSTGPKLVLLLATRCLYCGVHLTKGQPDPKADKMSCWPNIILLLATRCFYLGSYIWAQVKWTQLSTIAHYHGCSIDKYRNVEGLKCHNFGRLGISHLRRKGFVKLTPKAGRVSFTFMHLSELKWGSTYARGLWYHLPFRGPMRLTNYNFHTHVQYCITMHCHSCSIDKYRNVEGWKWHNFGRLGISCFEKAGFCKTHPQSWESFLHIPSPTWADLRFLLCYGSEISSTFQGTYQIDKL